MIITDTLIGSGAVEMAEVDAATYRRLFPRPAVVYNSVEFTSLVAPMVTEVKRVAIMAGGKARLGLTIGVRADGTMAAPFSAPFACFDANDNPGASMMLSAVAAMRRCYPGLRVTLPPPIYSPSVTSKTLLAMMQQGCSLAWTDWNYHLPLTSERGGYERLLCTGRRTILRRASRDHFHLETVDDDPLRAYNIVEAHHAAKGYPMRMSARQILDTTGVDGPVDAHFFVLTDGSRDAAAAIVYDTTPDIAQVIYWADNPSAGAFAPMNLLCARLHDHYAARGFKILDIGPSSSEGVAATGLCDFKERVGCVPTAKPTIIL